MTSTWQILAGNLAVVALIVLGWGHARFWLRAKPGPVRAIWLGITMGLGSIASMLMAAEISAGIFLDLRLSLITVSAFFGGPISALITAAMSLAWRYSMGGAGIWAGLIFVVIGSATGLICRMTMRHRQTGPWQVMALAGAVGAVNMSMGVLADHSAIVDAYIHFIFPMTSLNMVATVLAGLVIMQARRLAADFELFAAAAYHSPDHASVKDRYGRFVMANRAVAHFLGLDDPHQMIGKTDFDFLDFNRARLEDEQEQRIIASGLPHFDMEEQLPDRQGRMRWFTTSKIPLQSVSGERIGLTIVTRDITDDKTLRQDLIDSRNTLSYAMAEMSDGLAVFDNSGRIEFCNEQYRQSFPHTGLLRQPGAYLGDILRAVLETGEQLNALKDNPATWAERILSNLHRESEEEVHLFNDRWLQVRTRPARGGKTMVVVSDITRIKHAELALHSKTDQLRQLVRTDSLTGLLNRRAFDDAMETEIARSARTGTAMSLLLIDVDRFKSYNDEYGHPSGDECLRVVAKQLQTSLKRPADLAVRYGGEEFAAILPETDEDGAYLVAEAFRKALAERRVPHGGSERGILTASIGVATYMPDNLHRSAAELIQLADEALYSAKAAGRDRVYGTRVRMRQRQYAQK